MSAVARPSDGGRCGRRTACRQSVAGLAPCGGAAIAAVDLPVVPDHVRAAPPSHPAARARQPTRAAAARAAARAGHGGRRTGEAGRSWPGRSSRSATVSLRPCRSAGCAPGRDQVGDRRLRVLAGDQGLADQDGVGAGVGVGDEVVRAADAGLGDLDDVVRDLGGDALEGAAVDLEGLQVARVDADDLGAGVHGALDLVLVVHLDERGEPDGHGALDQRVQGRLVEGGDDQQREVGAVARGPPTAGRR